MELVGLRPLDILWAWDAEAWDVIAKRRGKVKLWVVMACRDDAPFLLFRINTRQKPGAVFLPQALHPILTHDSWLHCGGPPIELAPPALAQAIADSNIPPQRRGQRGRIAATVVGDIRAAVQASTELSPAQRDAILAALSQA